MRASDGARTDGHTHACAHPTAHTGDCDEGHRWQLGRRVGVQRLEVLVAVMLARERRVLADAEAGSCTALAAALATLPSGVLEIVADAVAALG